MTFPFSPDDRADPADQHAVRARVPDHVARGVFSTGVIVMTAPTEFVIDFIQNLGRPHQVVARIVMPHPVLPQFVDALLKNIELYRGRYGNLPQPNLSGVIVTSASGMVSPDSGAPGAQLPKPPILPSRSGSSGEINPGTGSSDVVGPGIAQSRPQAEGRSAADPNSAAHLDPESAQGGAGQFGAGQTASGPSGSEQSGSGGNAPGGASQAAAGDAVPPQNQNQNQNQNLRRASAQEIYDDLKLRDEILSGSYANAVMIGHGPHEFSFDFITNFYPHSAVSARVFLAAGQVARLAESLRGAWDQIRHRFGQPPESDLPPPSS